MNPADLYSERFAKRTETLGAFDSSIAQLATARLVLFILAAVVAWYVWQGNFPWTILLFPLLCFIALVAFQSRLERKAEQAKRAIRFYTRGLARLNNSWHGTGESGDRFQDSHHPYSLDLDLFGRGSLFELLSTARTKGGEARLADWLLKPSQPDAIRLRQEAIIELRPLLDWRETLSILGEDFRSSVDPTALTHWATSQPNPFSPMLRTAALALAIVGMTAILFWLANPANVRYLILGLPEVAFAIALRHRILGIVHAIDEPAAGLDLLSQLVRSIEGQSFQSPLLQHLRKQLDVEGEPASERIAHLRRWQELLDSRDNVALRVFGPLMLWTTQIAMALENWRAANGPYIPRWLDALSEIEALSSLASYAFENPQDPFPVIVTGGAQLGAIGLTHPLLPRDRAVPNTISLSSPTRLYLVSGSNMSGKSTLLRTVGINAVLALAGAPVRAASFTISALSLGASIRTTDSLEEGHSRFMAEIIRLKQVLELPAPALFLLDELLHGTNSHDRAIGSEGLVRALLDRGAIGFVTTHDLSLSRMVDEIAPAARNVHFEDRLENGHLVFDYKMREGVVTRSNALDLMRAVGLNV